MLLAITIVIGITVTLVQNAIKCKNLENHFSYRDKHEEEWNLAVVLICNSMVGSEILG